MIGKMLCTQFLLYKLLKFTTKVQLVTRMIWSDFEVKRSKVKVAARWNMVICHLLENAALWQRLTSHWFTIENRVVLILVIVCLKLVSGALFMALIALTSSWLCIPLCVVRWLHALCDGISNEDEAELAIDHNYHCVLCRPTTGAPAPGKLNSETVWLCVVMVDSSIILYVSEANIAVCHMVETINWGKDSTIENRNIRKGRTC